MQKIIENRSHNPAQRCQAAFALAKAYESDIEYNESFTWYKKANDLRPNLNFTQKDHENFCKKIIDGFGPDGISSRVLYFAKQIGKLQTGYIYHYAFAMLFGLTVFISYFFLKG